jgi:hypothetical protein
MADYYGATENDLLIGDMTLGSAISKADYLRLATDEVDTKLALYWVLPLPASLTVAADVILGNVVARVATARIILSQPMDSSEDGHNSYGASLLNRALRDLEVWLQSEPIIPGATRINVGENNVPSIFINETRSGLDVYDQFVAGCEPTSWYPGQV